MIPKQTITDALGLLPPFMTSPEAEVLISAIGAQESEWIYRQQIGGPAHSFLMFEEGGIRALMSNYATETYVDLLCEHFGLAFSVESIYDAILTNDVLAVALGRLLLYADPKTLPAIGDQEGAWRYYLDTWRPGRPRPQDWPPNYQASVEAWQ